MSNVNLEIYDSVAKLTLDRPAKRNALTPAMLDTLEAHLATVESSRKVRVVTLSGAGDKAFCAGADIKAWGALDALGMWNEWIPRGQRIFSRLANLRQPVIALMNGYAFGGGLELALACDIRIAASSASFAMPEVKIAAVPGWSGTARLANIIGIARAKMMILTGDSIDAQTALAWGLVTKVCSPDRLSHAADELVATITSNAPIAVQMSKQLLDADCAPLESIAGALSAFTDDGQEGVQSFSERRKPDYKGT